jgi:hypothetical protein
MNDEKKYPGIKRKDVDFFYIFKKLQQKNKFFLNQLAQKPVSIQNNYPKIK